MEKFERREILEEVPEILEIKREFELGAKKFLFQKGALEHIRKRLFETKKEVPSPGPFFEASFFGKILEDFSFFSKLEKDLFEGKISLSKLKEEGPVTLKEYNLPEEIISPLYDYLVEVLEKDEDLKEKLKDKTPEEIYKEIVGESPKGKINQEISLGAIFWEFEEREDQEKYYSLKFGPSFSKKSSLPIGMVTLEKIEGKIIPVVSALKLEEEYSPILVHEKNHLVQRLFYEKGLPERLEKFLSEKEFFYEILRNWQEGLKNEILAYLYEVCETISRYVEESKNEDFIFSLDFKKFATPKNVYDYPYVERGIIENLFYLTFEKMNKRKFKKLYKKLSKYFYHWQDTITVSLILLLHSDRLFEAPIKEKKIYLSAKEIEKIKEILPLFVLYPADKWSRLLQRLIVYSEKWSEMTLSSKKFYETLAEEAFSWKLSHQEKFLKREKFFYFLAFSEKNWQEFFDLLLKEKIDEDEKAEIEKLKEELFQKGKEIDQKISQIVSEHYHSEEFYYGSPLVEAYHFIKSYFSLLKKLEKEIKDLVFEYSKLQEKLYEKAMEILPRRKFIEFKVKSLLETFDIKKEKE